MGMVFRNADGTSSGRDYGCHDLFLVDILGTPQVVQSTDLEGPLFPAITLDIHNASIEEVMTLSDNTTVFPNPAKDQFVINYKLVKPNAEVKISVFDIQGKLVLQQTPGSQIAGWYNSQFSTESLQDGIYMVQVSLDTYIAHTERIVISR
jgi:hypothetical protein